jgi:hypothetical protein
MVQDLDIVVLITEIKLKVEVLIVVMLLATGGDNSPAAGCTQGGTDTDRVTQVAEVLLTEVVIYKHIITT